MIENSHAVTNVVFGLDPFWVSIVLFVVTYLVIISDKVNRAIVAGLGAALMVVLGVLNQETAISGIDFNTLGLLTGMMVIVAITRRCGVFQFVAIWTAKRVAARPWPILLMLSIVTAVFSALLDNVTTVLLIVPVTLLITGELKVSPYPYLFAEIISSNIGGAATLIGDPPNIMIGSAAGLSFNDFLLNMAPIMPLILAVTLVIIYVIWGRGLTATDEDRERIMSFREREAITNVPLLKKSMFVLLLVILGFVLAHPLRLEPATIALFGAAILLLLVNFRSDAGAQSEHVQNIFGEVEWITIFFFVGLFVLVHGIERAGVLDLLAEHMVEFTGGDMAVTAMTIIWVSAVFSAIVDNIPFVATMIPLIKSMAPAFGGAEQLMPLW
ncbi:MAG: ArsB/NhaD family transporter, partial [Pseudomonadota bacterium]|nr:ArsB/NhaD family transporter [Pseudomonadota bacterium]